MYVYDLANCAALARLALHTPDCACPSNAFNIIFMIQLANQSGLCLPSADASLALYMPRPYIHVADVGKCSEYKRRTHLRIYNIISGVALYPRQQCADHALRCSHLYFALCAGKCKWFR